MFNLNYPWLLAKSLITNKKVEYTFSTPDDTVQIPELKINDISMDLPWNPDRKWGTRPLSIIDSVIVHQTLAANQTLAGINKYHITPGPMNHISSKGCPHICYHYAIEPDGRCYKLNDDRYITWHCKGHNAASLGVLVNGKFRGPRGLSDFEGDDPSVAQIHTLKRLLNIIVLPYGRTVKGHCDYDPQNKSACPGYVIEEQITNWSKNGGYNYENTNKL